MSTEIFDTEPHGKPQTKRCAITSELDAAAVTVQSARENLRLLHRFVDAPVVSLQVCPGLFVQVDAALVAPNQGASQ